MQELGANNALDEFFICCQKISEIPPLLTSVTAKRIGCGLRLYEKSHDLMSLVENMKPMEAVASYKSPLLTFSVRGNIQIHH